MKQVIFHILCMLSYLLRPLRHNLYKKVLQYAYELQGVKFRGGDVLDIYIMMCILIM